MKNSILLTILLVTSSAFADDCPVGEYVRGHCRTNPRGYEKWHQRLSNERLGLWNYKEEKSKKWSAEEALLLGETMTTAHG